MLSAALDTNYYNPILDAMRGVARYENTVHIKGAAVRLDNSIFFGP
jgi:hypothetical protein